jgi:signal transduction histidine kinase
MRDDIGELIRSFNEMTKKLKKAKEKERLSAIGEAVTWIVHELKNSLISIKAFVQLFPQRHKDEKFVDKFSRLVPEEINRLERMFKELSDFSSHSDLRITKTDAKEVMGSILEIMRDEFIEKKIDIKYSPQNDDFHIKADPERLRQVFLNLIINSINAMPEGGLLTVSIEQANLINPTHIEVRIGDTGKGMSGEVQEKIFEPFHTTGAGLGLTISRKIVEQHGGKIAIESEIDKGTTFIVRLPVEYKNNTV